MNRFIIPAEGAYEYACSLATLISFRSSSSLLTSDLVLPKWNKSNILYNKGFSNIKTLFIHDFIDKYIGWTITRTTDILNANMNRVILIRSVSQHDKHAEYEFLIALTKYIDTHDTPIIIAGCDALMDQSPGLRRRFIDVSSLSQDDAINLLREHKLLDSDSSC